ncbi:hypothetical protein PHET_01288 [Paragonimus heterotremus]|uniref:Uncharacterized protein n=1 Tax=Paragonimus heterotremus TaxID=100268 RepID=A0A8J4TN82_9TREM|nr:hypothetical protein PHET_01288 [Paragonimus heterotremus]
MINGFFRQTFVLKAQRSHDVRTNLHAENFTKNVQTKPTEKKLKSKLHIYPHELSQLLDSVSVGSYPSVFESVHRNIGRLSGRRRQ